MAEFKITKADIIRAFQFSESVISSLTYLKDRGQKYLETIKYQIIIGKLGEIGTKIWMESLGFECSVVDFNITENKSYAPDLLINTNIPCHVKSQDLGSAKVFELSWTFQYSGKGTGHTDKHIFENFNQEDFVVFCLINGSNVNIKAKVPVAQIHNLSLLKEPKKKNLKGIKKVIYFADIPEMFKIE